MLEGISEKAHVPHLFVLDRDERSRAEINRLRRKLSDRVHVRFVQDLLGHATASINLDTYSHVLPSMGGG